MNNCNKDKIINVSKTKIMQDKKYEICNILINKNRNMAKNKGKYRKIL